MRRAMLDQYKTFFEISPQYNTGTGSQQILASKVVGRAQLLCFEHLHHQYTAKFYSFLGHDPTHRIEDEISAE